MIEITKENVDDLIVGTTILGTGGGGSPEKGRELLNSDLQSSRELRLVEFDEIAENVLIVSPYRVGSIAANAKPTKSTIIQDAFGAALDLLEKRLGRRVGATVATELGGLSTALALHVASILGVPLLDGDLLGRAGPELHHSTTSIFEVPVTPSVIVSETGNMILVERYADLDDYEGIARYVSVLAGGLVAVIDTPLTKEIAQKILITGTISKSIAVGKTLRNALREGRDPLESLRQILDGYHVFCGVVEKCDLKNEKGFLFAAVVIKGMGNWYGHSFRSWIKNEHIFAWLDDKPIVMPPDLIIFLDQKANPITNDALEPGLQVNVLAAKAPEVWRSPRGLSLFGPRHFGLEYDYTPVETLVH